MSQALRQILFGYARAINFSQGGDFTSVISASRAQTVSSYETTASGSLSAFSADTARITNLGLMVEPSATNKSLQSGDLTNAAWTKNLAAAATGISDPFGGALGATITATATTGFHGVSQTGGTETAGSQYTHSIFVKQGTAPYAVIGQSSDTPFIWGTLKWSDLSLSTTACTAALDPLIYVGGYRRFSITYTRTATGNNTMLFGPGNMTAASVGNTNYSFAAAGTETVIGIGAQSEQGASATSPIPTSAAAITRNSDTITLLRTGVRRIVFVFSDGTAQTVTGIDPTTQYVIPTTLNKPIIARLIPYAQ